MVDLGKAKIILTLAASLVLAVNSAPQEAVAQGAVVIPAPSDDLLGNVVHIVASGNVTGFGLIVGRDAEIVWIATAAHVVEQDDPATGIKSGRPSISVGFKQGLSSAAGGKVLGAMLSDDLAFVSVRAPLTGGNFDPWRRRVIGPVPSSDTPLILSGVEGRIGFEQRAGKGVASGRGSCVPTGTVAMPLWGNPGQSGAPVASGSGFVGIYLGKNDRGEGCMVPMDTIGRSAIQAGIPWHLEKPEFADTTPARFCIVQAGSERPTLKLAGLAALDASGCVSAPIMPYRIVIDQPWLIQCRPNPVIPVAGGAPIAVSCAPRVDGTWKSQGLGTLIIREKVVDGVVIPATWTFEGLNLAADGPLQGEIHAVGSELHVNGKTFSGRQISGQLAVERTQVTGSIISTGGQQYSLSLMR